MVTNFDTSLKPVCDFVLVNTINLILSRTVFQLSRSVCHIIAFDKGVPLVDTLVLGYLECRYKSYIVKNLILFGYM